MNIDDRLDQYIKWRKDLHAHPELAFEETRTSDFVAQQLTSFGISVERGLGGTGLVGTLSNGSSNRAIGLRADMDALPMDELNSFAHASKTPGRMHACGHDGHTVMLLAAAQQLAESPLFNGTVHFIFQPAEEANDKGSGAQAMIADGLFERFPMDCIFALHNAPGLQAGAIATRSGAIMASMDMFEVVITGKGTHGAFPQSGNDPIVIATTLINAWQTIVSRNVSSQESAVLSVTSVNAGDSFNVIPNSIVIKGSIRALSKSVQLTVKKRFIELAEHIVKGFDAAVSVDYREAYPVTVNDAHCTEFATGVAAAVVGDDHTIVDAPPVMGSEDFSYMLQEKPGCYLWIGNSDSTNSVQSGCGHDSAFGCLSISDPCMVHEPTYDFNDSIISPGLIFFYALVESYLPL